MSKLRYIPLGVDHSSFRLPLDHQYEFRLQRLNLQQYLDDHPTQRKFRFVKCCSLKLTSFADHILNFSESKTFHRRKITSYRKIQSINILGVKISKRAEAAFISKFLYRKCKTMRSVNLWMSFDSGKEVTSIFSNFSNVQSIALSIFPPEEFDWILNMDKGRQWAKLAQIYWISIEKLKIVNWSQIPLRLIVEIFLNAPKFSNKLKKLTICSLKDEDVSSSLLNYLRWIMEENLLSSMTSFELQLAFKDSQNSGAFSIEKVRLIKSLESYRKYHPSFQYRLHNPKNNEYFPFGKSCTLIVMVLYLFLFFFAILYILITN